jgi:hypothetical protein
MPKYRFVCEDRHRIIAVKEFDRLPEMQWADSLNYLISTGCTAAYIISAETPEEARARVYGREGDGQ